MKCLALFFALTIGLSAMAASSQDSCRAPLVKVMKTIAKNNALAIGMKVSMDEKFLELKHQGIFQAVESVPAAQLDSDRIYKVRLDNGHTYQYWTIRAIVPDFAPEACAISGLSSDS